MTLRQVEMGWAAALCLVALAGWYVLQRQVAARRFRLLLVGELVGPDLPATVTDGWGIDGRPRSGRPGRSGGLGGRGRPWSVRPVPELLLIPLGLAAGQATGSPVPAAAAALAVLPLHRWRSRCQEAGRARQRAEAVVELCAALAAELRSGATPEQALHLVTVRLGEDRAALHRLGEEPVARLAAGRYGADVPAAFHLLAELPGGRGASAIAACWRVSADSGAGLAAALDQVAEALRAELALAEAVESELAAPRTTIAVLAVLPLAGLPLGAALGTDPVAVLLHTPVGLALLLTGATLEALGLLWTGRIVRTAARSALGAPEEAGARRRARPGRPPDERNAPKTRPGTGGWRCGVSRTRARDALPSGAFRSEVRAG